MGRYDAGSTLSPFPTGSSTACHFASLIGHRSLPTFLEGSVLYSASYRKLPLRERFYPIFLSACSICPSGNPSRLFSPEPEPLYMAYAASTSLHSIYHDFPPVKNSSGWSAVSPTRDREPRESRGPLCLVLMGPQAPNTAVLEKMPRS